MAPCPRRAVHGNLGYRKRAVRPHYLVQSASIEVRSSRNNVSRQRLRVAWSMTGSRTSDNEVIGVRQYVDPNPAVDQILLELAKDDVVTDKKMRSAEIFFSKHRDYQDEGSHDRGFGDNRLFLGDDRPILLTFLPRMK
jgi:hypothetical protein